MEIININDIEDLIITKYKIETKLIEDNVIESKMSIPDFISKYTNMNYIYKVKNLMIPFGFNRIYDVDYLFVVSNDENELDLLTNKLKLLRYNLNNMSKVDYLSLMKNEHLDEEDFIIYNNNYYK
jgi:hypothetical protein